jgi:hypothetical protein
MGVVANVQSFRLKFFLWIGLPIIAGIGIVAGMDVGSSWRAKAGEGTPGTFTAVKEDCGRSCSFYGNWKADDGTTRRTDVILYDEPDSLRVGGTTPALDSGARNGVYATGSGSSTYLLTTGLMLAGIAAAIGWIVFLVRTFRRRLAARATTVTIP